MRVDEAPAVKVDISNKLDVDELEVNNNNHIEADEEPNIEEKTMANVSATKSICSKEASKLDHYKKSATIRVVLALAVVMGLEIHQMDVQLAFLNGKLDVEIYMEQPEGIMQKSRKHFICKLRKLVYKLKQSGRAWYECAHVFFVNKGFTRSHADH